MTQPENPLPAGWYPDPGDPDRTVRWWDGAAWTDRTQPRFLEQPSGAIAAPLVTYDGPPILVSTMNDAPGFVVTQIHGEVFGLVVRARNLFSNFGASLRTIFGGEAKGYTQLLADSRQEALARLRQEAHLLGGNAVLAARFDSSEIANLMSEVAAYGTAVTIRPLGERPPA
ncbi:MAG TPA: heavy metal-binding domain-containing protein [Actinomycetes bacterium]|nr:heavy metal-binding domain-containing protein [Actinomycetes bacterium]